MTHDRRRHDTASHDRRRQDPKVDIPAAVPEDANEDAAEERPRGRRSSFRAWQEYYEQRQRVCYRHALVLESMLAEDPANRLWLESHGFSADVLVRYLRWNPAEQLRQLERMEPARRARYAKQLHAEHWRNLRRMEENLKKVLPLFDECAAWSDSLKQGKSQRSKKVLEIEELEVYAAGCTTGDTESTTYHSDDDRAPLESVDSDSVRDV